MLLDYFWWRNPIPSGGATQGAGQGAGVVLPKRHPWIHLPEEQEPEVVAAVVEAVQKVAEKRTVPNPQVDEWKAEQEFRKWLEDQKIQWMNEYSALIRMEYEKREQEYEDAQIAMLLFDM